MPLTIGCNGHQRPAVSRVASVICGRARLGKPSCGGVCEVSPSAWKHKWHSEVFGGAQALSLWLGRLFACIGVLFFPSACRSHGVQVLVRGQLVRVCSPSTTWVQRIELRLSVLAAGIFAHGVISPDWNDLFCPAIIFVWSFSMEEQKNCRPVLLLWSSWHGTWPPFSAAVVSCL